MRLRLALLSLLAVAIAPVAAPAAQAAEGGPLLPPLLPRKLMTQFGAPLPPSPVFRSGFQVEPSSGGYKVGVSTSGGAVVLVVSDANRGNLRETVYAARGVGTRERLQATFGRFGKVLMRFHESSEHAVCHGTLRLIRHKGVFAGSLRFRGERGYVSVHVHRAVGGILEPAGRCPRQRQRHRHFDGSVFLENPSAFLAESRHGVDLTGLLALEFGPISEVLAIHEESRGKLAILRGAIVYAKKAFHVNEAATAARVSPQSPFHGTGRYRAAPDGTTTWTGNLTVDFPGAPRFPLTGPEFQTLLEAPF